MKKGWQTKRLGDVAKVSAGNSAPQDESLFKDGVHPFFRTADAGRVRFGEIHESADYLNDKGIKGLRSYPRGTILFPKSGASTFLNHRVMLGVEGCVSSHLATIVADTTQIEPRFLLYFLSTVAAQDLIQDHAYPSLNLPTIAGIEIEVPPIPEQKRIVVILDKAFEGIATAKANAEKNLQNARALFESHLNAVFSRRGKGWVKKTLGDVLQKTGTVNPLQSPETEFNYIDVSSVSNATFQIEETQRLKGRDAPSRARRLVKVNDVLLATVRPTLRRIAIVPEYLDNQVCSTGYFVLRPKVEVDYRFVFYLLFTEHFMRQMESLQKGASYPAVTDGEVRAQLIHVPPLPEQHHIVEQLDYLSEETQHLKSIYQQKLTALEELKKSLLNQAFTGQL